MYVQIMAMLPRLSLLLSTEQQKGRWWLEFNCLVLMLLPSLWHRDNSIVEKQSAVDSLVFN